MDAKSYETLLTQADEAARQGDWQTAFTTLEGVASLVPQEPGVLTGLGTCLIQLGRVDEALPHFEQVASLLPNSAEAQASLGLAYALAGRLEAAAVAYQRALALDGENPQIWKSLASVYLRQGRMEEGVQILASLVKANPDDPEALYLLAQCYEAADESQSARLLYERVLKMQPDHLEARQALERLSAPASGLPRLARPEHAQKLAVLKNLRNETKQQETPFSSPAGATPSLRVAFYGPPEASTEARLGVPARALAQSNARVKVSLRLEATDLEQFDCFVVANPHLSPQLLEVCRAAKAAGKRLIVDLERNFHAIPRSSPQYPRGGGGNPQGLRHLEQILPQADVVTFPHASLLSRYQAFTRRAEVIPYLWDAANPLWHKPSPPRSTFNLGLVWLYTEPNDLRLIKEGIRRLVQENPRVLLSIAGEYALYRALSDVAEERRLYLPAGRIEDYPYLLAQFDLLLLPSESNAYNQARSDLPLLEAGVRGLPWVASPAPAFQEWGAGGLLVSQSSEWYEALKTLVNDAAVYRQLSQAGRSRAASRRLEAGRNPWLSLLLEVNQ